MGANGGEEDELWPGQFEARGFSRQRKAVEELSKSNKFLPPLGPQFSELRRHKEQQKRDDIAREQQCARREEMLQRDRKAGKDKCETPSVRGGKLSDCWASTTRIIRPLHPSGKESVPRLNVLVTRNASVAKRRPNAQ